MTVAVLIANASGTLGDATTFAAADAVSLVRYSSESNLSTTFTSSSFTVTNGVTVDAVLLYLRAISATITGTITVDLRKGGVSQASVTVNKADLPDYSNEIACPVLFKLSSTASGDGGSNWTIVITTTGSGTISYGRNSTATGSLTRALRTTTAATPAAGDDLFIVGELTGAGTHTSYSVGIDDTIAGTVYGSNSIQSSTVAGSFIAVACYGTLYFENDASTNYLLQLAGDLFVYALGEFTQGAPGDEIPRDSTAIVEFQPTAHGGFGIRVYGGTWKSAGLSRTADKNIWFCRLTADVVSDNKLTTATGSARSGSVSTITSGAEGIGNYATAFSNNATNSPHGVFWTASGTSINVTETAIGWFQGASSGTTNRYMRFLVGDVNNAELVNNGFYVDIDLLLGTIGSATAIGSGTAIAASITPVGDGYVVKLTGITQPTSVTSRLHALSCPSPGTISYIGDSTFCFRYDHIALVSATSIADTVWSVDEDTGWLAGDNVVVCATTSNYAENEVIPLAADADTNSFSSVVYPFGSRSSISKSTHHGTDPYRAEVALLTRNVKVRSDRSTFGFRVYVAGNSVIDVKWVEFLYMASTNGFNDYTFNIAGQSAALSGLKDVQYCSFHYGMQNTMFGFNVPSGQASLNLTFSNNVAYYTTYGSSSLNGNAITADDFLMEHNLLASLGTLYAQNGWYFNYNIVCGCLAASQYALGLADSAPPRYQFNYNTIHASNVHGFGLAGTRAYGTIVGLSSYRNKYSCVYLQATYSMQLRFKDLVAVGSSPNQPTVSMSTDTFVVDGGMIVRDAEASAPDANGDIGISLNLGSIQQPYLNLKNVDFTGSGDPAYAAHNIDIDTGSTAANSIVRGTFNNCSVNNVDANAILGGNDISYMEFQKWGGTLGDHRSVFIGGWVRSDADNYHTNGPSLRMQPVSADQKLWSAYPGRGMLAAVPNGEQVDVSIYVRKSLGGGVWNLDDLNGDITISNNSLTVACPTSPCGIRGAQSHTSGKFYIEYTSANGILAFGAVGIVSIDAILGNIGTVADGFGVGYAGNLWNNGVSVGGIGSVSAGTTICVAIDLDNMLAWARKDNGNWNNNAAHDPVTGAGGINISAVFATKAAFPLASPVKGDITANFGGSAFTYTPPSGFGAWNTNGSSDSADYNGNQPRLVQRANSALGQAEDVVIATAVADLGDWELLSGTSSVATDNGAFEFIVDCDGTRGYINIDDWVAAPHV